MDSITAICDYTDISLETDNDKRTIKIHTKDETGHDRYIIANTNKIFPGQFISLMQILDNNTFMIHTRTGVLPLNQEEWAEFIYISLVENKVKIYIKDFKVDGDNMICDFIIFFLTDDKSMDDMHISMINESNNIIRHFANMTL